MLDTNTASYFVTGRSNAVRQMYFEIETHSTIALSVLTEAELRFGLEKKPLAARLRSEFEGFFEAQPILPWTSDITRAYARLRFALQKTGKSLSVMDLLIASHAFAAGAILVSHDKAIQQVAAHVLVEDWATDL